MLISFGYPYNRWLFSIFFGWGYLAMTSLNIVLPRIFNILQLYIFLGHLIWDDTILHRNVFCNMCNHRSSFIPAGKQCGETTCQFWTQHNSSLWFTNEWTNSAKLLDTRERRKWQHLPCRKLSRSFCSKAMQHLPCVFIFLCVKNKQALRDLLLILSL